VVATLRRAGQLPGSVADVRDVLAGWLEWLASGPAAIVLVALEDLWLETDPHNRPGLSSGVWTLRFRRTVSEIFQLPLAQAVFRRLESRHWTPPAPRPRMPE
jgi:hypothetical protein